MRDPALSSLLIGALLVGCRPASSVEGAADASLPPCQNEAAPALDVPHVLAIQEDRQVVVEGYLVKGRDTCLACEDGSNLNRSTDSIRLADSTLSTSAATLGLDSTSKRYHCWSTAGRPEKPCALSAAGQHVRMHALYVRHSTTYDGPSLSEPDICGLSN
jgi:hypothetical protein